MQKVKWLYAAFFALSFALIVEWTGSFTVQRNISWFSGLTLPVFWLDATTFTALYSAATALEAFVVSDALVKGAVNPTFGLYASVKFSSALFLALFFAARNPLLGLVTMTVDLSSTNVATHLSRIRQEALLCASYQLLGDDRGVPILRI